MSPRKPPVTSRHEDETLIHPTWRARIADPKPPFCSGCLRGADAGTKFVDLWMPIERGFLRQFGTNAVIAELNRLCLCESCVREMSECLAFDPELHRSHQARIDTVAAERDRLQEENEHLRALVADGLASPHARTPATVTVGTADDDEGWDNEENWEK